MFYYAAHMLRVGLVLSAVHVPHHARPVISAHHRAEYLRDYRAVAHKYGRRAPGRNIIRWGFVPRQPATDAEVVTSIGVLQRMLAPPVIPAVISTTTTTTSTGVVAYASAASAPAGGSLESCIIQHESGGNRLAVNGQYQGIGQWSPSSWAKYSHGRYGASPLDASYAHQEVVLRSEGTAGMIQQQGIYDGCA